MSLRRLLTGSGRTLGEGTHTGRRVECDRCPRVVRALVLTLGLACFMAINRPVMAQTNAPGPVRFPVPGANSSPAPAPVTPAPAPAPAAPTLTTPPLAPQAPDTGGDIRDIRGVMAIPYEWLWAAYLLIGLVVAGLLYAAWRFFRGRSKAKEKMPFELALDLLDEAYKQLRAEEITLREYAFLASEIIRRYIEQRFGEKAARRTTEEFLSDLLAQTGTPLALHRDQLENFLNHCDLIKFARWGASESELESMHESARAFILDTRPQPEPVRPAPIPVAPQPELAQAK